MKKDIHRRLLLEWRTDEQIKRDTLVRKIRRQSAVLYAMWTIVLGGIFSLGINSMCSCPTDIMTVATPYIWIMMWLATPCLAVVLIRRDMHIQKMDQYIHTPKYLLADQAFPDLHNRKDSISHSKYRYFIHRVDKMCRNV